MATKAKRYIPEGYATATPYLTVRDAAKALDFYKKAFNASETVRLTMPNGKVGHAEVRIGNSIIMLGEEDPTFGNKSPTTLNGSPVGIALYVEDCDAIFKQALTAGAKEERPLKDQFYGDRSGGVVDPFGHHWMISTHIKDVTPEEMKAGMAEMAKTGM